MATNTPDVIIPLLQAIEDQDLMNRLWSNVVIDSSTGCWEYQGYRMPNGYCRIMWTSSYRVSQRVYCHRLSWVYHNQQEIPEGMFVCHHCDNRCCLNPDHLFIGTQQDNMQDASKKDRLTEGVPHKLSWLSVFWIRKHCNHKLNGRIVSRRQLMERLYEKWNIQLSNSMVGLVVREVYWPDPNWDPETKTYIGKPQGWQEDWGDWST